MPRHGGGVLLTGNPGNSGGGRPPEAFRALCRDAVYEADGVGIVTAIATGTLVAPVGLYEGGVVLGPPPAKVRLEAVEWLASHGYGRAPATVELVAATAPQTGAEIVERLVRGLDRLLPHLTQHQRARVVENARLLTAGDGDL